MTSVKTSFDKDAFLKNLTTAPGVYRFFDKHEQVLYVGKAKNLKNRLQSYFRGNHLPAKTRVMLEQAVNVEVTITNNETEALLLENTYIKEYKPRYNILLRDDKSYPYIAVTTQDKFPRMVLYRGSRKETAKYYGPYPSVGSARMTISLLQKIFKLRQCDNTFFKNRTRPCLQYQIKRCTAPCVGLIGPVEYQENVYLSQLFLEGKNQKIVTELSHKMEAAAALHEYEKAATLRDQIAKLNQMQIQQSVVSGQNDVDIFAIVVNQGIVVIEGLFIRHGQLLGNKTFFPRIPQDIELAQILSEFLPQYYLQHINEMPKEIVVQMDFEDRLSLARSLTILAQHQVSISYHIRTDKKRWLALALQNADYALQKKITDKAHTQACLENLAEVLNLNMIPRRIECFDVSHHMGTSTVASCVVFNEQGPVKQDYRRFNVTGITEGDDYAALKQVLMRRYLKLKDDSEKMPDIILIDGGKGQLGVAKTVLLEIQVTDVFLMSIAKGPGRKPGLEVLHLASSDQPLVLPPDSPALHFLQHVRDEAHRFAITGHRKQSGKKSQHSVLEDIPGIGPKRRRALLVRFGGLQGLKEASLEELAKTEGISLKMAELIYSTLH